MENENEVIETAAAEPKKPPFWETVNVETDETSRTTTKIISIRNGVLVTVLVEIFNKDGSTKTASLTSQIVQGSNVGNWKN